MNPLTASTGGPVLLTGMHRSATSLFAQALARAGIDMGQRLNPAGHGNRHGHFEDVGFLRFHEDFMAARGIDALAPPPDWAAIADDAADAAARALVAERSRGRLWGFKDPRASLFLEFWLRHLDRPLFVFLYRHPVEVLLSLLRRGSDPRVPLEPRDGMRTWTAYNRRILEFRRAHPAGCLLWEAGAAVDLEGRVAELALRLDQPLDATAAAGAFESQDLRRGLVLPPEQWQSALPDELALYAELEAAADRPASSQPTPVPGEESELSERLLWGLLCGASAGLPAASRASMVWVNEAELDRLRDMAAAWDRVEQTRSWRLLNRYWSARSTLRRWANPELPDAGPVREDSPPLPGEVLIGCVMDSAPRFRKHALRLVQSLRWFGGSLAQARVLVCAVGDLPAEVRARFESLGAEVREVRRLDERSAFANKLQFFPEALEEPEEVLLLLDCDTVVVQDPLPFLRRGALRATLADVPSISQAAFRRTFRHFSLALPRRRFRTTFGDEPVIAYFNSGVLAMPAGIARDLEPAWRDYNLRLLDEPGLLGDGQLHANQAALSLAIAACSTPVVPAPPGFNLAMHQTHLPTPPAVATCDPAILHVHDRGHADGSLHALPYAEAQRRVEAFNERWIAAGGAQQFGSATAVRAGGTGSTPSGSGQPFRAKPSD